MTASALKNRVQAFLNDKKLANRLLSNQDEYSLEDVINCSSLALDEINNKGLVKTLYTLDNCEAYLLTLGTAKYLLAGSIALKSRNYITINDGGVSVNREGNIDLYYRMYENIRQEFEDQLDSRKTWLNIQRGFGH